MKAVAGHSGSISGRLEQLGVDQALQEVLRLHQRHLKQGSGDPGGEVLCPDQPEQAEQPPLRLAATLVAQGERRAHLAIADLELVQPSVLVPQPLDQLDQAQVPTGREPRPGDRMASGR